MFSGLEVDDLRGAIVLVVHAHPDDEGFATGPATIAAKAAGARTHLRLFRGGEGRASLLTPRGPANARRAKEARLAASSGLLGIDTWGYLTGPGHWTDTPHAPRQTISSADTTDLAAPVSKALEVLRPDMVLTVGPDGLTGHPDHIACHDAVTHALATAAHHPHVALGAACRLGANRLRGSRMPPKTCERSRRPIVPVETSSSSAVSAVVRPPLPYVLVGPAAPGGRRHHRRQVERDLSAVAAVAGMLFVGCLPFLDEPGTGTGSVKEARFVLGYAGARCIHSGDPLVPSCSVLELQAGHDVEVRVGAPLVTSGEITA